MLERHVLGGGSRERTLGPGRSAGAWRHALRGRAERAATDRGSRGRAREPYRAAEVDERRGEEKRTERTSGRGRSPGLEACRSGRHTSRAGPAAVTRAGISELVEETGSSMEGGLGRSSRAPVTGSSMKSTSAARTGGSARKRTTGWLGRRRASRQLGSKGAARKTTPRVSTESPLEAEDGA